MKKQVKRIRAALAHDLVLALNENLMNRQVQARNGHKQKKSLDRGLPEVI